MIITAATPKGGTGKTTTMGLLASALLHAGNRVCLIDSDPNHLISDWVAGFPPEYSDRIEAVKVSKYDPPEALGTLAREKAESYEHVLIDLEGIGDARMNYAMINSDFVLVPMQPSAADEAAAAKVVSSIMEQNRVLRVPIRFAFLLNRVSGALVTRELTEIRARLEEGGVPLLVNALTDREAFRRMFRLDLPLWDDGLNQLSGIDKARSNVAAVVSDLNQMLAKETENA